MAFCQQSADAGQSPEAKQNSDKFNKRIFRGMVIAGFNATQVDGDRLAGYYNFGFNGGVGAFIMLEKKRKVSISAELLYSMKGAKSTITTSKVDSRTIALDYAEIPIMVNFHDKQVAIFGAGFAVGGLVRNVQKAYDGFGNSANLSYKDANGVTQSIDITPGSAYYSFYRKYELGVVAHATFLIKKVIGVQARFNYSMLPIAHNLPDGNLRNGNQWNNALSLRLMYIF
jgi:hypothetical protein